MKNRWSSKILAITLVCLVMASISGVFPTMVGATGKFNIGDTVEVITNLNVRTGPGTNYPEITDPDYPGYAPAGTRGRVIDGPTNADGYIWWKVDFGPGLYSGWSVEGGLQKVSQPPPPPTPSSPGSSSSPGPTIDTLTPTFYWSGVSGADYYGLYIRDLSTNILVFDSQARGIQITGTSYRLPSGVLEWGKPYRWNMNSHNGAGWSSYSGVLYFQTAVADVTLTLYVHEDSASGPVVSGVRVTGQDGAGYSFDKTTNTSGYITITGTPGTWSFVASKSGYQTNSWSQSITSTTTKHAYLIKQVQTPTVETRSTTDVTQTAATLNGRIISDGGSTIIERRFDWGTTSSCSDGWTASVSVSGSYFSYRLTGLNPSTTYYFRAWAKNSAGWSYGSVLSFTTQSVQPPSPPTPTWPGSSSQPGSEIDDLTPTLQWSGVSNADYYALAISKYPYGSSNIVYNPQQLYGTSHTVPSGKLEYGQKYRWNMQAHNSAGWSSVSSTLYFQTYTPVQTPTVETRSAISITETAATLNGRVVSDGGSSIIERRFDWGTTSSCSDGWTASVNVSGSYFSYSLTGLNPGTTYYFRAWARNSAGWRQGSVLSFITQSVQPPPPPTPISPGSSSQPGPEINDLTPTLQWSGVSNADYYALAISKYPYGSSNIVYNPQQLYGTSHTVPSGKLEYGQKYRWNMQAHNSAGWSDVSSTLYFQTTGVQKPDLIIEGITWSPADPSIGDTVTFTVTIKNQGTGKAGSSKVYYFIDDVQKTYDYVNSIDAGATATETFTWKAQDGTHAIKAVADYKDEVAESDETNNDKTVTFSAAALSDLIIESITWSPASPSIGETVTFTVTIKNQGTGKASTSKVYYFIDNAQHGYDYVGSIDLNAAVTETFTWEAQAGAHLIKAIADYKQEVEESDETNNDKTVTFSTTALSDLIIESITWSPTSPSIGDTVTFTVTVKNQGSGKAGGSKVYYFINNAQHGYDDVTSVGPSTTATETFTWKAQAGLHAIKAVADYKEEVAESDEANNEKAVTFSVTEEIVSVPNTPSGPTTGVTAISYTYSTGGATSSYGHDIEYRFDWGDGNYSQWSSLTSASHSWSNQGTYTVRAQARSATNADVLSDWSERFTVKITAETVLAKIDSYSPADSMEVEVGESIALSLTLTNTGNTEWTFYAAASLRKPDGSESNLPPKPVVLSPGDQGNVSWSYTVDQEGGWDIVFGVWKEEEQASSLGHTGWINNCIVGKAPEALPATSSSPASFSFTAVEGQATPSSQTLNIWNSGRGTLNWAVSSDVSWLLLSPASGSSTGETDKIRVLVDISGMDAGDYRGTITIRGTGAIDASRVVPAGLSIRPKPLAPPNLTVPLVEAPSEGIAGQSISVTFVVENRGDDASGPFHNFVALSPKSKPWGTNIFLADVITDSILPDDSKKVTVDITIPPSVSSPGDYHVTVYADAFEQVRESNEGNNIGSTYPETIAVTSETPTIADLITSLATGGVPVTVDGELYFILTLENRIDPLTLEVVPGYGATKVYVDAQNYPVSDKEIARQIGLIDLAYRWIETAGSPPGISQELDNMKSAREAHESLTGWKFASNMLTKAIAACITTGKSLTIQVVTGTLDTIVSLTTDPMRIRELLAYESFNIATEEYQEALNIIESGSITKWDDAEKYFYHLFTGHAYNYPAIELLLPSEELSKSWLDDAADMVNNLAQELIPGGNLLHPLENLVGHVEQLPCIVQYKEERNRWLEHREAMLSKLKLHKAAPYTLELANSPRIVLEAHSPVEIRLYDSEGRVTGIVNGEERSEIPYSVYDENTITIFSPTDSYRLEISGTGEGSYDVSVTRIAAREVDKFTEAKIPVSVKATHQLTIDWDTFSQEEDKLPIQVDSDGDGIVEQDKTEYLSVVGKEEGLPAWIWFAIGLVVGLIASFVAWRRMIKNKERAVVEPVAEIQQREDDQSGSC